MRVQSTIQSRRRTKAGGPAIVLLRMNRLRLELQYFVARIGRPAGASSLRGRASPRTGVRGTDRLIGGPHPRRPARAASPRCAFSAALLFRSLLPSVHPPAARLRPAVALDLLRHVLLDVEAAAAPTRGQQKGPQATYQRMRLAMSAAAPSHPCISASGRRRKRNRHEQRGNEKAPRRHSHHRRLGARTGSRRRAPPPA